MQRTSLQYKMQKLGITRSHQQVADPLVIAE